MTQAATQPQPDDLAHFVELDAEVDRAEHDGIYARWDFGRELLARRVGKQLPNGLLDELAEAIGKSRAEIKFRVQFADRFPTREEVANAVSLFTSWHRIVNEALASTAHLSNNTDEWTTPDDLFAELDAEFGFTLDVCATAENAKCAQFFTATDDALSRRWKGVCWMNPPYSATADWIAKARHEAEQGATVVCLVAARTDVAWFWDDAREGEIRLLRGRLHFTDDEGNTGPAPFPSCLVIFGRPAGVVFHDR